MRLPFRSLVLLVFAFPLFAAVSSDVTLPAAGYLNLSPDLQYRTEAVLINHSDKAQYVAMELIRDGRAEFFRGFSIGAHETLFLPTAGFPSSPSMANFIGALRIRAVKGFDVTQTDPTGQIEAKAYIIADRPISRGTSRQEVEGVPSEDYHANETFFLGVRHSPNTGAYTNVGITNLHPTETVTFYVQFQYQTEPTAVTVPPLSLRQFRVTAPGSGGRWVRVYPEWHAPNGNPVRTTPWVAYASTVDMHTGDAFSGTRVPAGSHFRH